MTTTTTTSHTRLEGEIVDMLARLCGGGSFARRTIERLMDEGLLSDAQCKALLTREKVAALQHQGFGKVEAMQLVANDIGCSFSTVRNYIYP